MFMGFIIHFYIIFGTNLLTRAQCQFLFLPCFRVSKKKKTKRSPIDLKFTELTFGRKATQETWSPRKGSNKEAMRQGARPPPWAHPPASWTARRSTDVLLPPIYTHIP